jgi:thiamine biosynthesis lipoprotein
MAVLISAAFITAVGLGIFTFTLPLLNFDERASGAWLGTAFAGYYLAKMVTAPVSGILSDKFGPRAILIPASLLSALLPLLYLPVQSLSMTYAIQLGLGFTSGMIRTVTMAVIGNYSDHEEMHHRFSMLSTAFNAAFFFGPVLGGWLYMERDFVHVLCGVSILMAVSFVLFLFSIPRSASTACPAPLISNTREEKTFWFQLPLLLSIAGRTAGIGALMTFYPVLLKTRLSVSGIQAGMIFTVPNLTAVLLLPIAGRMLVSYDCKKTAAIGMLLSSAGLYLLSMPYSTPVFILFGIITGLGSAISIPASMTLSSALNNKQGHSHGKANLAANIGFFAGPLAAGFAVRMSGATEAALQSGGLIGAAFSIPLLGESFSSGFKCSAVAAKKIRTASFTLCLLILALSPFSISSFSQHAENMEQTYRYTDAAMGTVVNITIEAESSSKAEDSARKAIKTMRFLQKDFDHRSRFGSIGRVNKEAGKEAVEVSERAYTLISHGLEFGKKTAGVFDITIGAVTDAPFYYALSDKLIRSKKNLVDYRKVKLFPGSNKVFLPVKGMALDMGGLAKGTILDAAALNLRKSGIKNGMIEGGGDFACFGERKWVIGLKNPRGAGMLGTIRVRNQAVCGSGDYRQFIISDKNGDQVRRHHIIDINSMESADESIATTVLAPDAETADALATSMFIMGPDQGGKLLKKFYPRCSAMWVLPDMSVVKTKNFPAISNKADQQ